MKHIKVLIQDKNTLKLCETGNEGDIIDLTQIYQIDTSAIEKSIVEGKDQVYQQKLQEQKALFSKENEIVINNLKSQIKQLQLESEKDLNNQKLQMNQSFLIKQQEIEKKYQEEKQKLQTELQILKDNQQLQLNTQQAKIENQFKDTIFELKTQIREMEAKLQIEKLTLRQELNKQYQNQLNEAKQTIEDLKRQRASLNVKRIGEDLEIWCDNAVRSYMQNGFQNCTWQKDNKVIKEETEVKGSKADYIFKIFADSTHTKELASICLDMKSENPDSINKKKNADYFATLEKNRIKKECKYALLVSELEMDSVNDLSIYKVPNYENMYVVRPSYLMVFLNMITSITTRFANLLAAKKQEELQFKDQQDLIEEFNKIKETYLDKPLEQLKKQVENIQKIAQNIKESVDKIQLYCEDIHQKYIQQIEQKIDRFDLKLEKSIIRKIPVNEG